MNIKSSYLVSLLDICFLSLISPFGVYKLTRNNNKLNQFITSILGILLQIIFVIYNVLMYLQLQDGILVYEYSNGHKMHQLLYYKIIMDIALISYWVIQSLTIIDLIRWLSRPSNTKCYRTLKRIILYYLILRLVGYCGIVLSITTNYTISLILLESIYFAENTLILIGYISSFVVLKPLFKKIKQSKKECYYSDEISSFNLLEKNLYFILILGLIAATFNILSKLCFIPLVLLDKASLPIHVLYIYQTTKTVAVFLIFILCIYINILPFNTENEVLTFTSEGRELKISKSDLLYINQNIDDLTTTDFYKLEGASESEMTQKQFNNIMKNRYSNSKNSI